MPLLSHSFAIRQRGKDSCNKVHVLWGFRVLQNSKCSSVRGGSILSSITHNNRDVSRYWDTYWGIDKSCDSPPDLVFNSAALRTATGMAVELTPDFPILAGTCALTGTLSIAPGPAVWD